MSHGLVLAAGSAVAALMAGSAWAADPSTASPIKHVIVIIAENRSFDHLYGTYQPKPGQTVSNILSKGIVNADGTPGPHFADAAQFVPAPSTIYFITAASKQPYSLLPPPDLGYTPQKGTDDNPVPVPGLGFDDPAPFVTDAKAASLEPDLAPADIHLLTTGATGLPTTKGPDTRVANYDKLPNGPFPFTSANLPYDSYTGDTVHRFYQMWQQSDCSPATATPANPSGCLNDLYPWVTLTAGKSVYGGAWPLSFYNMSSGDAPYFKQLADEYTLADNYHQAAMGGTGIEHVFLGFGDDIFYSDKSGKPAIPGGKQIADPNPEAGGTKYRVDATYTECADGTQAGVGAVAGYLAALAHPVKTNCEAGHFYLINNTDPAYEPDAKLKHDSPDAKQHYIPPVAQRHIGDALAERGISFAYYGGGYRAASHDKPNTYCNICNPFEYASSIMGDAKMRAVHVKDTQDLIAEIGAGTLPAVAYVKPDGWLDGHPATSKVDLFEAFAHNIISRIEAKPDLFASTAIFITFDEGGGYWDSGYIQPLDFFGDGPRIPTLAISPYSKGGRVVHTYYDHVSVLKFIERNWGLPPLTNRSRDRLPNPRAAKDNPYVPVNGPAIGDMFDMFDFKAAKK